MKCEHCEKPATFHITELTTPKGPKILHLCEDHARNYLSQEGANSGAATVAGLLAKQLKMDELGEGARKSSKATCPVCGITFADFRQTGRLGCPYDYVCFAAELEPLLMNIHGAKVHTGKRPKRMTGTPDRQHRLIQLRREMREAIESEKYELAGRLRDEIRILEDAGKEESPSGLPDQPSAE